MCTQVGDGAYKEFEKELRKEKIEEEKIESKIRQLRKERNRARLQPSREQGPATKRRKLTVYKHKRSMGGAAEGRPSQK